MLLNSTKEHCGTLWVIFLKSFNQEIIQFSQLLFLCIQSAFYKKTLLCTPLEARGAEALPRQGQRGGCISIFVPFFCYYMLGVYTQHNNFCQQKRIHSQYCREPVLLGVYSRKINVSKLESCNSTVGTSRDQESAPELNRLY